MLSETLTGWSLHCVNCQQFKFFLIETTGGPQYIYSCGSFSVLLFLSLRTCMLHAQGETKLKKKKQLGQAVVSSY